MAKTAYPELLLKAKWDKEKGLIAKIVKSETGVGAMLDEVKKSYDAVPWGKLDDTLIVKAKSAEAAATALADGKAVLNGQIEAARKKALDASRLGTKVAAEMKKITLCPKSTREYLEKMSTAALNFATAMRDETIETLKKFEAAANTRQGDLAGASDEIKKIGEEYIKNRKAAVIEMQGLKKLFTDTRVKIATMATNADKLARDAVAKPATAAKAASDITAMQKEAATLAKTAIDKYGKDGSVNTNPVQRDARGNIHGISGKPQFDDAIKAYQTKSAGDFNTIMGIVAEILTTRKEIDTGVASIDTSLDIAKDASTASTKPLSEHQASAKAAVSTSMDLAAKAKEEFEKISKRIPLLQGVLTGAKTKPETIGSSHTTFDSSEAELNRRLATINQGATQVINLQKRLGALPAAVQNDPVVKGEAAKLAGILKNFQAAIKMAEDSVAKAQKMHAELPPKP